VEFLQEKISNSNVSFNLNHLDLSHCSLDHHELLKIIEGVSGS